MKGRSIFKSVIVVGPRISQTTAAIRGFSSLGWTVRSFPFSPAKLSWNAKLLSRLWSHKKEVAIGAAFNRTLRERVLPFLCANTPTLVLFIKPRWIEEDIFQELARIESPIAIWTIDSISRVPDQNALRLLAQNAFYLDGGDVQQAGDLWLPLGYEEELYDDLMVDKKIDVLFTGSVGGLYYTKRRELLLQLKSSKIPRRYRVAFAGTTGSRVGDFCITFGSDMECTGRLPARDYARAIASAKVCVNIHQDDGKKPINSTFLQIPAAATCQLAEQRPYLAEWLEPGKDYIPFSEDSFLDTLEGILEDSDLLDRVSQSGRKTTMESHGFKHRVQKIIATLGLE